MTGKTSLNLMLHLQIGKISRKLFLGSMQVLENPLADLEALNKRTQSRRFIPLTTMPSSIENLGGWQHIWPRRRKYQTSSSTRPMTAFILTCATGSCSTYMTRSLLMKEVSN